MSGTLFKTHQKNIQKIKPIRLLLLLAVAVALAEFFVMLVLPEFSFESPVTAALIDGLIILFILIPLTYLSLVRPLINILQQANKETAKLSRQMEEQQLLNEISSFCSYASPISYKNHLTNALEKLRSYCDAEAIKLTVLDELGGKLVVLQVANKDMDTTSLNKIWRHQTPDDYDEITQIDTPYTVERIFEENELESDKITVPILLSETLAGVLVLLTDNPTDKITEVINFAARVITTTAKSLLNQRKLSERSRELQQLNDSAQDGIVVIDERGLVESWNPAATAIFGYTAPQVTGKPIHQILAPERFTRVADHGLEAFLKNGHGSVIGKSFEIQANHSQGHEVPVELSISAVKSSIGWKAIGIVRDITLRKQVERRLEETLDSFSAMVSNSNEGILIVSENRTIEYINEAAASMLQSTIGEIEGQSLNAKYLNPMRLEHRYEKDSNSMGWMEVKISHTIWRGKDHKLLILRDITDSVELRESLSLLSKTDELTGLYNRRGFIEASDQLIKIGHRLSLDLGILFIDLDGMKPINDTYGHDAGDEALRATAHLLKRTLRKSDIVGRLGGDEFVALIQLDENKGVDETLKRIQQEVDYINRNKDYDFTLSLSLGWYAVDYEQKLEALIEKADEQMYQSKLAKGIAREQTGEFPVIDEIIE